jgi:hypothetical protein
MADRRHEGDRVHQEHIYVGEPDEDLIEALEPDQLVLAMDRPVARLRLSAGVSAGLWALRIGLLLISAMVVYVFVLSVIRGASG